MSVITISREFGSEGTAIAEKTAQALGYHFADKNTLEKILNEYGLMEFDRMYETLPGFWDRFDAHRMERRLILVEMLNKTIIALARHGNMVIVGRGGFAVLEGLADVLHVRVQAPLQLRIRRAVEQPSIAEPSRGEMLVAENDRIQKAFIESIYGVKWDSAKNFDLVIDTGKISPDMASEWLVEAVKALKVPDLSGIRTLAKLGVDRILASAVEDFFKCAKVHV
ncbi:MAG: cytidylate kinase-like family protein [Spirochaetes bacterium]|nr:cytidylate kinase-like family protein [Spirochaetota bacterium]